MRKVLLIALAFMPAAVIFSGIVGVFTKVIPEMFRTMACSIDLLDVPDSQLVIPDLQDTRFGKVVLNDQDFYVVVGRKGERNVVLFDTNANHNLTDDYQENIPNYESKDKVVLIAKAEVDYEAGRQPYYLVIEYDGSICIYYGITRREGKIIAGDREYRAAIAETDSDGLYDKDNILVMVDLNGNGKYEEYEISRGIVRIGGEYYSAENVSESGKTVSFEKTDERVVVPVIGSKVMDLNGFIEGVGEKSVNLEAGKWKVVYFSLQTKGEMGSWLKMLNGIADDRVQVIAIIGFSTCDGCERFNEKLIKDYKNIQFVPLPIDRVTSLMESLRVVLPQTLMVLSPDDVLVYRTPVAIITDQPVWKAGIVYTPPDKIEIFLKSLIH